MSTAFVTLTDSSYAKKAYTTLHELRQKGEWEGDIVLMAVDFEPDPTLLPSNVLIHRIPHLDHQPLFDIWQTFPLEKMADNRHHGKVYQWDKLQVFSPFFRKWERIVFLDAGMRVLGSVAPLLELPWQGRFLAPDDSDPYDNGNRLVCQFDWQANPLVSETLRHTYPITWEKEHYFLNCIFVFDTSLLQKGAGQKDLVKLMYEYPICRCNEMGIMNLKFVTEMRVWEPFPQKTKEGKYLFGWNEANYKEHPNWTSFHFIKYSRTAP